MYTTNIYEYQAPVNMSIYIDPMPEKINETFVLKGENATPRDDTMAPKLDKLQGNHNGISETVGEDIKTVTGDITDRTDLPFAESDDNDTQGQMQNARSYNSLLNFSRITPRESHSVSSEDVRKLFQYGVKTPALTNESRPVTLTSRRCVTQGNNFKRNKSKDAITTITETQVQDNVHEKMPPTPNNVVNELMDDLHMNTHELPANGRVTTNTPHQGSRTDNFKYYNKNDSKVSTPNRVKFKVSGRVFELEPPRPTTVDPFPKLRGYQGYTWMTSQIKATIVTDAVDVPYKNTYGHSESRTNRLDLSLPKVNQKRPWTVGEGDVSRRFKKQSQRASRNAQRLEAIRLTDLVRVKDPVKDNSSTGRHPILYGGNNDQRSELVGDQGCLHAHLKQSIDRLSPSPTAGKRRPSGSTGSRLESGATIERPMKQEKGRYRPISNLDVHNVNLNRLNAIDENSERDYKSTDVFREHLHSTYGRADNQAPKRYGTPNSEDNNMGNNEGNKIMITPNNHGDHDDNKKVVMPQWALTDQNEETMDAHQDEANVTEHVMPTNAEAQLDIEISVKTPNTRNVGSSVSRSNNVSNTLDIDKNIDVTNTKSEVL
ncbi:unnamed protein product [Owenia fusiformis]|uniref:Uncharacterized protein n=1 Tax=Owenia fusiformis TaxID=6347 RepID=A0A8J1T9Y5_OWEFU|nr:unnamed protein product [Owenia fusiformis]